MKYLTLLILFVPLFVFAEDELDCAKAWTTLAINQCMYKELVEVESVMGKYFTKSVERYAGDDVSVVAIKKGQEAWLEYRDAHCSAVYDTWRDGTIRTAKTLDCKIELTHQRTKVLWQSFLTYVDSTPSLLPEPKPYEPKSY